jgi:hypothetical protein
VSTTSFTAIYDRFLGKITDDMYLEVTPEETIRDLQFLLIDAIPNFEFPRCDLSNYTIATEVKNADEVEDVDFILRPIWNDLDDMLSEEG